MVLLARVSSNPPSPVPLLQTSKVWVPVCFRMDTGMGLGPWALALGGAWAFAWVPPSAWGFFREGLLGVCASRLPLPSQTLVTQQHGSHLLPHALFSVCCDAAGCPLLGLAGFVCRGGSCAKGGPWLESPPPAPTAQPMRALLQVYCAERCPSLSRPLRGSDVRVIRRNLGGGWFVGEGGGARGRGRGRFWGVFAPGFPSPSTHGLALSTSI
jgi:hypothetical protein